MIVFFCITEHLSEKQVRNVDHWRLNYHENKLTFPFVFWLGNIWHQDAWWEGLGSGWSSRDSDGHISHIVTLTCVCVFRPEERPDPEPKIQHRPVMWQICSDSRTRGCSTLCSPEWGAGQLIRGRGSGLSKWRELHIRTFWLKLWGSQRLWCVLVFCGCWR